MIYTAIIKKRRTTLPLLKVVGVLLILHGFSSCKYPCRNPEVFLRFESFDSTELTQVVYRRFQKEGNYSILDTEIVTSLRLSGPDRHYLFAGWGRIDDQYDLEFTFPVINKTYRIKDIHFENESQSIGIGGVQETCSNSIVCTINGNTQSVRGPVRDGDYPGEAYITVTK